MNFLFFLLACAGMTFIIVDGSIFNPLRKWLGQKNIFLKIYDNAKNMSIPRIIRLPMFPVKWLGKVIAFIKQEIFQLIGCHLCTGFWSGVTISAILRQIELEPIVCNQEGINYYLGLFCFGCVSSAFCFFIALVFDYINRD